MDNKCELNDKLINSKKPLFILGQSVLNIKSGKFVFESLKKYLTSINKINSDWNSLNILSNHSSTVGSYDLDILSSNNGENIVFEKNKKNEFDFLFLFGQDNLHFKKNKEFIVYIGSHGDRGAEIADVILPGAAYTEQDGYYTNLEGKIQKAYQASYPPGLAKEDWKIINDLSKLLKRKKLFNNKNELIDSMMNYLRLNQKKSNSDIPLPDFINETINIENIDYYYSNVIARSSSVMTECRNIKQKIKKTGTEG